MIIFPPEIIQGIVEEVFHEKILHRMIASIIFVQLQQNVK